VVIVNGEISEPFIVTRGVRQGDPLSCLLFNLVIEPLACLIRNSDLKGVRVPGKNEDLALVEHFKCFSEKIGGKCPLFFALFFSLKKQVKHSNHLQHFLACFKFFTLKMKK
jgi:hypothetical protein